MFHNILGPKTKRKVIRKIKDPRRLFLKIPSVFLSIIINIKKLNKKYIAAYFAKNAKPKNNPNNKKLCIWLYFIIFKRATKDSVQNNNSSRSVEIKKEETLAAGIIIKLIAHNNELCFDNDNEMQSL